MQIPAVIAASIGVLLIAGAWNKKAIQAARKFGKVLSPLSGLSFTLSKLGEQDKDSIARLWLLWIGGMIIVAVILGVVFRVGN